MNNTISELIKKNKKIISKIKINILKKNEYDNEMLSALKINELILLELTYKNNYNNEENIIKSLNKMQVNLNLELLKNS